MMSAVACFKKRMVPLSNIVDDHHAFDDAEGTKKRKMSLGHEEKEEEEVSCGNLVGWARASPHQVELLIIVPFCSSGWRR